VRDHHATVDDICAQEMEGAAIGFGVDLIIEIQSDDELEPALELKSLLVGINNCNFEDFTISLSARARL
jgi:indole-3-glycerol phosphate synthase